MSDGAWAVLGVVIGAALAPALAAVGYMFRRRWDQVDRQANEKRKALYDLQDAIVDVSRARWSNEPDAPALRRVRIAAARVGDPVIWELANRPPPPLGPLVGSPSNPGDLASPSNPGNQSPAGDELDAINSRVRELLLEL